MEASSPLLTLYLEAEAHGAQRPRGLDLSPGKATDHASLWVARLVGRQPRAGARAARVGVELRAELRGSGLQPRIVGRGGGNMMA